LATHQERRDRDSLQLARGQEAGLEHPAHAIGLGLVEVAVARVVKNVESPLHEEVQALEPVGGRRGARGARPGSADARGHVDAGGAKHLDHAEGLAARTGERFVAFGGARIADDQGRNRSWASGAGDGGALYVVRRRTGKATAKGTSRLRRSLARCRRTDLSG
jgi:hypothetical protein